MTSSSPLRDDDPLRRNTLEGLLAGCADELSQSARSCGELQWVISRLLEIAHHPDIAAEMHVLQDIDRLQQTLADIASLITALSDHMPTGRPAPEQLVNVLRLESLRKRLFRQGSADDAGPDDAFGICPSSDVTWL